MPFKKGDEVIVVTCDYDNDVVIQHGLTGVVVGWEGPDKNTPTLYSVHLSATLVDLSPWNGVLVYYPENIMLLSEYNSRNSKMVENAFSLDEISDGLDIITSLTQRG